MRKAIKPKVNREDFTNTLNEDQLEVFNALEEFCKPGNDEILICIQGYAGTGKTYVITKFFEYHIKKPNDAVCLTAPTNKAVGILKTSTSKEIKNLLSFETIHKILGIKAQINKDGKEIFTKSNEYDEIGFYKYLVIDEVSMLDDELFFALLKAIDHPNYKPKRNRKTKVIFMGDPKQIPPVNKVDCEPFLNPDKYGIKTYSLEQIMRQKDGNKIIEASYYVRENILAKFIDFNPFHKEGQLNVINTSYAKNRTELAEEFEKVFSSEDFKLNPNSIKAIAWRNIKVDHYNDFIRKIYFGQKDLDVYMVNEALICNTPIFEGKDIVMSNSQEMVVKRVVEREMSVEIKLSHLRNKINPINVSGWNLLVEYMDSDIEKLREYELQVINPDDKSKLQSLLNLVADHAKACQSPFIKKLMWTEFYRIKHLFADVTYAYAITAHKSQGSTYNKVYVDVVDINHNNNVVERNRIIYTAITRASQEATIITNNGIIEF